MPLMGLLVDWTWLRKESLNWRVYQQNPQKTEKQREQGLKKPTNQPKNRIFKGCGTTTESMTCEMDVSEGKEEKNKRYLKQ